jgi:hypothetical protein
VSPAKLPTWALLAVAACAGAATMVVELSAVRLLAPWFGTSQAVWTNVIGVVLLALAAGYLLGARLSAGPRPARTLGIVLALAAVGAGLLPFAAASVARLFLPQGLALDEVAGLLRWGSLATALCCSCRQPCSWAASRRCAPRSSTAACRAERAPRADACCASRRWAAWPAPSPRAYVLLPSCGLTRSFVCARPAARAARGRRAGAGRARAAEKRARPAAARAAGGRRGRAAGAGR